MNAAATLTWQEVTALVSLISGTVLLGAFAGGLLLAVTQGVWERVGEVVALRVDAHNARKVRELQARVWRAKRGM